MILLLLTGCAAKSPTQTIIDHHVQLVDQALVAPDISDKAKDALNACKAGLLSAEQTYKTEILKYKSDIRYWKSMVYALGLLILLYVGYKVTKR